MGSCHRFFTNLCGSACQINPRSSQLEAAFASTSLSHSLHCNRWSPRAAVHLDARFGPFARENSAVWRCLLANLVDGLAICNADDSGEKRHTQKEGTASSKGMTLTVEVKVRRERVILAAALPAVAEPGERPPDKEKIGEVLLELRHHIRSVRVDGVHHRAGLRCCGFRAERTKFCGTVPSVDDRLWACVADAGVTASRPHQLPRELPNPKRCASEGVHVGVVRCGDLSPGCKVFVKPGILGDPLHRVGEAAAGIRPEIVPKKARNKRRPPDRVEHVVVDEPISESLAAHHDCCGVIP